MRIMAKHIDCQWAFRDNRLSLKAVDGELFRLRNVSGSVTINDCEYHLVDAAPATDGNGAMLAEAIRWRWQMEETDDGQLELSAGIRNESAQRLRVGSWSLLHGKSDWGSELELGADPAKVNFFCWQPWNIAMARFTGQKHLHSTTLGHFSDAVSKRCLLISFVTVDRMLSNFNVCYDGERVNEWRATCDASGFWLQPGQELVSETIRMAYYDDPYAALEAWAEELYQRYRPSFAGSGQFWFGYGSWRDGFTSQKSDWSLDMPGITKAIRDKLGGFQQNVIHAGTHSIMKDGLPGNWLTFETGRSGVDYRDLLREQRADGWFYKFWFSPYWFFGEAQGILEENRENLLKWDNGEPVAHIFRNGWEFGRGTFNEQPLTKYYLDGTHPKTKEYIKYVFTEYRKLGARAYMLDFLDIVKGAARYDESLLPVQASREIFRVIREAAGNDTHLQTAVASSPVYIGCVNSARVVRDFGEGRPMHPLPNWQNATYCRHDEHFANVHSFVQNALASWFTNKKVYINDLNALTIDQPVPLDMAQIAVTMFGLSGDSPVACGDDFRIITPERLRMVKMCLPRTTGVPRPVDLFDRSTDEGGWHIAAKRLEASYETYVVVAVFNTAPGADVFRSGIEFAKVGCDPSRDYRVFEFWNSEYVGTFRDSFTCVVPPGACKLYRIAEARDYPWLLSTDMHVEQGHAEIETLAYDAKALTLKGVACRPKGESGRLIFLMPRHLRLINHECANTMKDVIDMQTVISLALDFTSDRMPFELQFAKLDSPFVARRGWLPYATEEEWLAYVAKQKDSYGTRVVK